MQACNLQNLSGQLGAPLLRYVIPLEDTFARTNIAMEQTTFIGRIYDGCSVFQFGRWFVSQYQ
jgi:hypothetical protein